MRLISRLRDHRYCAFCKALRRVYLKKHIDLTNVLGTIAFSLAFTFAYWASPDPRGIIIFSTFIILAELFVYMRWRMSVTCSLCGFDPVLYKKSHEKAAARVKEFFLTQVENPEFWLSKSPLLHVQRSILQNEKKKLDRQVLLNRTKTSSLAPSKPL